MVVLVFLVQHHCGKREMEECCNTEDFGDAHIGGVVWMPSIDRDEMMFVDKWATNEVIEGLEYFEMLRERI